MIRQIKHYPSLLLIASIYEANWYELEKNSIKLINSLSKDKSSYTDREGYFITRGRGVKLQGGQPDSVSDLRMQKREDNVSEYARKTNELLRQKPYVHFCCALPQRLKGFFDDELQAPNKMDIRYLFGNFTYLENKEKIREIFLKCLRPK